MLALCMLCLCRNINAYSVHSLLIAECTHKLKYIKHQSLYSGTLNIKCNLGKPVSLLIAILAIYSDKISSDTVIYAYKMFIYGINVCKSDAPIT